MADYTITIPLIGSAQFDVDTFLAMFSPTEHSPIPRDHVEAIRLVWSQPNYDEVTGLAIDMTIPDSDHSE